METFIVIVLISISSSFWMIYGELQKMNKHSVANYDPNDPNID